MSEPPQLALGRPETIEELEREIDRLRLAAAQANAARIAAEERAATLESELESQRERSARAHEAIEALQGKLDALRAEAGPPGDPPAAVPHPEPSTPAGAHHDTGRHRPALARTSGTWLERALRQLARRCPPLAGRLLVVLVPGAEMDQERLVHLLAAGRLRRGRARTLGAGASFDALKRRLAQPGSIVELRLAPSLSFALAAVMIDPGWSAGARFTIAYQLPSGGSPGPFLEVNDGAPATVAATLGSAEVTTTITCPADLLTAVLAGERPAGTKISGDERALEMVRVWLEHAQSD